MREKIRTKGTLQRMLSALVALAMVISLMPLASMTAYAETVWGHIHDGISFTAWNSDSSLPNTKGNYFLTKDVTLADCWSVPTGGVNLCLNGHAIIGNTTNNTALIYNHDGANLGLYDCDDTTTHYFTVDDKGLYHLDTDGDYDGDKEVKGGVITGGCNDIVNFDSNNSTYTVPGTVPSVTVRPWTSAGNSNHPNVGGGGVIYNFNGTIKASGCAFVGNLATLGGVISSYGNGSIAFNDVLCEGNYANSNASVIGTWFTPITMNNCIIEDNFAAWGHTISVRESGKITANDTIIRNNTSKKFQCSVYKSA